MPFQPDPIRQGRVSLQRLFGIVHMAKHQAQDSYSLAYILTKVPVGRSYPLYVRKSLYTRSG